MKKVQNRSTCDAFEKLELICVNHIKNFSNIVFFIDLDSTIFDVSPRNQAILRAFAQELHFAKLPEINKLNNCFCEPGEYGYQQALYRSGISHPEILNPLKDYWELNFFSNKFLPLDQPYEGALSFLNKISNLTNNIYFLTGRHFDKMYEGTLKSLQQHKVTNFKEKIILKKDLSQRDGDFKKEQISSFKNNFSKFIFIDNEPVVLNKVAELKKEIDLELIFFDSCHSGQEPITKLAFH